MFPDRFDKQYVVEYQVRSANSKLITAYCHTYYELWDATTGPNRLDAYWCYAWGSVRHFNPDTMVLVTPHLCQQYPLLISSDPVKQHTVLQFHFPSTTSVHKHGTRGRKKTPVLAAVLRNDDVNHTW
jgi:hypothetical protein